MYPKASGIWCIGRALGPSRACREGAAAALGRRQNLRVWTARVNGSGSGSLWLLFTVCFCSLSGIRAVMGRGPDEGAFRGIVRTEEGVKRKRRRGGA